MKKLYEQPRAEMVEFSFQDQVVAQTGHDGGMYNRDDTDHCQFTWATCNYFWNPVTRDMDDCSALPPQEG